MPVTKLAWFQCPDCGAIGLRTELENEEHEDAFCTEIYWDLDGSGVSRYCCARENDRWMFESRMIRLRSYEE